MIKGIVAIAENGAIGKDGKLPWHYSADLKFFKQTTLNHVVVIGYATWESIGKPLPNRLNIVLSRTRSVENRPNLILMRDKTEVLALAEYLKCDIFIIGGAETYSAFADVIEEWIVTRIPETVEDADSFFDLQNLFGKNLNEKLSIGDNLTVEFYVGNSR